MQSFLLLVQQVTRPPDFVENFFWKQFLGNLAKWKENSVSNLVYK